MTTDLTVFSEASFVVDDEADTDVVAREALLDRAMGEGRRRKSSEKLRRGRMPSAGLAFVARNGAGQVIGSVRLWDVSAGGLPLLLLGPLAADPSVAGQGVGTSLMWHAIARATQLRHGGIVLVGDAPYYSRFGFAADKTGGLMMPGPVERDRFLGLDLVPGYLDASMGLLLPRGRQTTPASSPRQQPLVRMA